MTGVANRGAQASNSSDLTYDIELENVSLVFPRPDGGGVLPVYENFNLKVERGSFTILLGPSGCGKSTLLNVIDGVLRPTSAGALRVLGKDLREEPDVTRQCAYVFQNARLLKWKTLRGNVEFGLRGLNVQPQARWPELIDDLLAETKKDVAAPNPLEQLLDKLAITPDETKAFQEIKAFASHLDILSSADIDEDFTLAAQVCQMVRESPARIRGEGSSRRSSRRSPRRSTVATITGGSAASVPVATPPSLVHMQVRRFQREPTHTEGAHAIARCTSRHFSIRSTPATAMTSSPGSRRS